MMFFCDDCFKPNVLLQWQNISSEFCRQPVTQPRRFFGGSKSKPVDPLRFQFECICAGDLSVIGFREGIQKKPFFWDIFPKCGWVGWLIPKQGPNHSNPPKLPRKLPFSTKISPFVFPNLTKTLGWNVEMMIAEMFETKKRTNLSWHKGIFEWQRSHTLILNINCSLHWWKIRKMIPN